MRVRCEAMLSRVVSAITLVSPWSAATDSRATTRLRGVAMAAGRGSQAEADLDAAAIWLALEAEPPYGPPVGQAGDPVVAERPLLSVHGGGAKEPPDCANVALEGEIVDPSISWSRTPSDDTFGFCDIDRV
jgi:hypothetical protein